MNYLDLFLSQYISECTKKTYHYVLTRLFNSINKPATIILWKDNTKTISICDKEDNYDKLTGFSICVVKKFIGNSKFREIIEKYVY